MIKKLNSISIYTFISIILIAGSCIRFFYFTKAVEQFDVILLIYRGVALPAVLLLHQFAFKKYNQYSSIYNTVIILVLIQGIVFSLYFVFLLLGYILFLILIPLFETKFFLKLFTAFVDNIVPVILIAGCIYLFYINKKTTRPVHKTLAYIFLIIGLLYFLSYIIYPLIKWPINYNSLLSKLFNGVVLIWMFLFTFLGTTISLGLSSTEEKNLK